MILRASLTTLLVTSAWSARADTIGADPNDAGKVTHIRKGVKEIDAGGMFVLSHSQSGTAEGTTQLSSLGSVGLQYFLHDNVSVGAAVLGGYEKLAAGTESRSFGGAAFGTLHLRLGLGAFLRPTLGGGVLSGTLDTQTSPTMVTRATRIAGLVRIAIPFAYFPTSRFVLQAGPEVNISVGSVTPDGGAAETFTTVAGGFGISAGYAF